MFNKINWLLKSIISHYKKYKNQNLNKILNFFEQIFVLLIAKFAEVQSVLWLKKQTQKKQLLNFK